MPVFGIGTDIVDIKRFQNIKIRPFALKILSPEEITPFEASKNKNLFLAKKFSIKEAVSKALGVGIGRMLSFKDISIVNNQSGKPICTVSAVASFKITGHTNTIVHVSVSDTQTLIQSYAIAEVTP